MENNDRESPDPEWARFSIHLDSNFAADEVWYRAFFLRHTAGEYLVQTSQKEVWESERVKVRVLGRATLMAYVKLLLLFSTIAAFCKHCT